MWREEELNRALAHFGRYLRDRGYGLSPQASSLLREFMMETERRETIREALRKREKNFEDVVEGLSKLAAVSLRFASRERRTTVFTTDVRKAIAELLCKVWPICE